MITLKVDEAYAFDYLSILEVKKEKTNDSSEWLDCMHHLASQFDFDFFQKMMFSEEYQDMIKANKLTFEAVDKAKTNEVTAKDVDYCNFQRHLAKENFQRKFFGSNLSEKKIGYEKYLQVK